jgi:hypothetical protein
MLHVNKTQVWVSIEDENHFYTENVTEDLQEKADDGDPFFDTPISLKGVIELFAPDGVSAVVKDICPGISPGGFDQIAWKIFLCEVYKNFVEDIWDPGWINNNCTIRCYHKIVEVLE